MAMGPCASATVVNLRCWKIGLKLSYKSVELAKPAISSNLNPKESFERQSVCEFRVLGLAGREIFCSEAAMTTIVSTSDALTAALKSAKAGDTIELAPGNYSYLTLNNVTGVHLTSEFSDNEATVNGIDIVNSPGIGIDHLNITQNSGLNGGITIQNSNSATLDHLNIAGVAGSEAANGIFIESSTGVTVENSSIHNFMSGLGHLKADGLTVNNNTFSDLINDGIRGGGSSNVTINGNTFTDFHQAMYAHNDAIQFWTSNTTNSTHDLTITNNSFVRGDGTPVQGIFLGNELNIPYQNIIITGNSIVGGAFQGISVDDAQNLHLSGNMVDGFTDMVSWIEVENSIGVSLSNNASTSYIIANDQNLNENSDLKLVQPAVGDASALQYWQAHGGTPSAADLSSTSMAVGAENIIGSSGDDIITGSTVQSTMVGGDGADTLVSVGGADVLTGGAGKDLFEFMAMPKSMATITDFTKGDDTLDLRSLLGNYHGSDPVADGWVKFAITLGSMTVYVDPDGPGTADAFVAVAKLTSVAAPLTAGVDWLFSSSGSALAPSAAGGAVFTAGNSGQTLQGGAGNDTITATGGSNYLRGGLGNDSIQGGIGFDDINGNQGNDTIDGGFSGGDWLLGGQGDDLITAHHNSNILYGNLGNDTLVGGNGGDILRGGQGDDSIVGGAGNDFISGDRGNDTESGGAGADIFHGSSGQGIDRVLDFNLTQGDRVELDVGTTYTVSQVGADTVIDMGNGDEMILAGVKLATLTGNWIFEG
jgi:Ca2+-binding RTX toxin-like protein